VEVRSSAISVLTRNVRRKAMSEKDELVKAVDDAYEKVLEAEEAYQQALTALDYYYYEQEKGE